MLLILPHGEATPHENVEKDNGWGKNSQDPKLRFRGRPARSAPLSVPLSAQKIDRLHISRNAEGADEVDCRGLASSLKLHEGALGS